MSLVDESSDYSSKIRKSNRISKPIKRSLDLPPNQTVNTIKKIAKQNHISSGINCDADNKAIIKSKSDELSTTTASCSSKAKSSRKWEMWTEDDTKWFFEALCEHGKDFTNIQSYILQTCEKKGINQDLIKNKEQVRHYYYRTWHKIANSLNISNVVDKATQELYALINYGEIWKKFGSKFDNKLAHHLPHLVNFGHTIFKVKGKSVRIKTPFCRALKKIHNINVPEKTKSNNQSLLNLPKEVCIELHPANNEAWLRVHSLSQNPRIRTSLSLQKRVSTLVEYLEKRWNQSRIRDSECRILCGTSLPNASQMEESCHLRVRPHISGDLNTVLLTKPLYNSQNDLSLSAYLKKLYNQEVKSKIKKTKTAKSKDKTSDDVKDSKPMNDTQTDASSINEDHKRDANCGTKLENENFKSDEEEPIAEAERSLSLLKMLAEMNEAQHEAENHVTDDDEDDANKEDEERDEVPSPESCAIRLPEPPANATLAQWLSGKDEEENDHHEYEKKEIYSNSDLPVNNDKMCLSADRAKKGWNLKETGSMTIGELYLLFRCPQKIVLEYLWEPIIADNESICFASAHDITSELDVIKDKIKNQDVLTKLLFAANLAHMNLKKKHTIPVSQTQKKKRIKPTPVATNEHQMPSQLLSSVISNTIFNDNSDNSKTNLLCDNIPHDLTESHNFVVPTSPAPKAVSKTKSRTVCGDPALIQEALRQLQSTKYTRRQRRPTPKPVFGHQNKPLLPRGSPSITSCSTTTSTVSSSQPIYMIPSRPLHINAIATVASHSGASIASSLLSQSLPVAANVKMTAINANQLSNTLQNSIRQTLNSHSNNDLFDVLLPQQKTQTRCDTTTNVNTLIKSINSSNMPIIQNMAQLLEPISSVAVPLINPSLPTLQHLQAVNTSASITENAAVICTTSDTMSSMMTSLNRNIESRKLIDNNSEVISCKNGESNSLMASSDSTDRLLSSTHTISSLLEISLPEPPFSDNSCSGLGDSFEIEKRPFEKLNITDTTITRMPHTASNNDPTLPTSSASLSSLLSPPIERHKSNSPIGDTQWLNGESGDISIGTLLNACESPCKTVSVSNNSLANDVDTQMSCLATDNSIDLMAKFADLAAQIVDSNSKST